MKAKVIAISDLHLTSQGSRWRGNRLTDNDVLFEKVIKQARKQKAIVTLSGDIFDKHGASLAGTVNYFINKLKNAPDVHFYAISGNHDRHSGSSEHSTLAAINLPNFHLLDNGKVVKTVNGLTIQGLPNTNLQGIRRFAKKAKQADILLTHQHPEKYPNEFKVLSKIYRLILNGHNHNFKVEGNIVTVGAWIRFQANHTYRPSFLQIGFKKKTISYKRKYLPDVFANYENRDQGKRLQKLLNHHKTKALIINSDDSLIGYLSDNLEEKQMNRVLELEKL